MIKYFRDSIVSEGLGKEQKYTRSKILSDLFEGIPNLENITVTKSNEYDDNNYYDNLIVVDVNGVSLEDDYYIRDDNGNIYLNDSGEEYADKDKILDQYSLELVCDTVRNSDDQFSYGEHVLTRNKYLKNTDQFYDEVFMAYYISSTTGKRVNDELIFKDKPELALCYAYDVLKGRLSLDLEKHIIKNKKIDFYWYYLYAVYVIKDRLPKNMENKFNLKSFNKSFHSKDKHYFNLYKDFLDSKNEALF